MVARNEVKRSAGNLAWAPDPGFRSRFIQATIYDRFARLAAASTVGA